MKKRIIIPAILFSTGIASGQSTYPNVIYVFPDQLRNSAMEFWGMEKYKQYVRFAPDPVHTPNLNKFADESVVLSFAQSNCPLSSPHRGMLLTGMYPQNNGVTLNCNSNRPVSNLKQDAITISDIFSQNGYDCAYIGKLHVDYPTPNNPQNPGTFVENQNPVWDAYTPPERRHGFNYWYSYGTYDVHKSPHYWDTDGIRHEVKEWSPKHETDKAIEYLESERNTSKPFFLMISMNPPHGPYSSLDDCEEIDYNLYKDIPLEQLLVRSNINPELKNKQASAPYYFASITGVDREFGRLLSALDKLGLAQNTIVVFSSDHGETMASHVEDPKNSPYTEAINVPFIIRYPGILQPHVSDMLLSTPDITPTLLSLAGLKDQIPGAIQGYDSSGQLLKNKTDSGFPYGILYIRNMDGDKDKDGKVTDYFPVARGIVTHQYTLAITIDKTKQIKDVLFFNDQKDPYQLHNLSVKENEQIYLSLCKQLGQLLKETGDPWYEQDILSDLMHY